MNSRRNIILVAIIALTAGLLATTWSVAANNGDGQVWTPCRPSGVYVGVHVPPSEYPFMLTVIPTDPAGDTLTTIYWSDNGYPNLGIDQPPFSECDYFTKLLGHAVKTGPTSSKPLKVGPTSPKPHRAGPTGPKPLKVGPTSPKPLRVGPIGPKPLKAGPTGPKQLRAQSHKTGKLDAYHGPNKTSMAQHGHKRKPLVALSGAPATDWPQPVARDSPLQLTTLPQALAL